MLENIEMEYIRSFGDETALYKFHTTKEHYTIRELIEAVKRNTSEVGKVEVVCKLGRFRLEFWRGKILDNNIPEILEDETFIEGTAHGGYSVMDYTIVLQL